MLGKYIILVYTENGTVYAYRHLENDLRSVYTLTAAEGRTVDFSDYFGELNNATVTGGCINGEATDATKVAINAGAANGSTKNYDVVISLADGTKLTFVLAVSTQAKHDLAALIKEMEVLTSQVATYNPTGQVVELALNTKQGSAFYVSTNADQNTGGKTSDGGGIAALVDNKEEFIYKLQRQKAELNVKQTGEDLEVWCDNEVIS